jgi:hypothetical protein
MLDALITIKELTETVRGAKGTTPGPDGIPNWHIAGPMILEAWNFLLQSGLLVR